MAIEKDDLDLAFDAAVTEVEAGDTGGDAGLDAAILDAGQVNTATESIANDLKIDATGRAHAKDGKFTNKPAAEQATDTGQPAAPVVDPVTPATDAAPATTLQPHTHWTPALKAAFPTLSPEIQKALLDREADMDKGRTEWSSKAEEYNQLQKLFAPYQQRWAMDGMTPASAVNALLSAQAAIERDPIQGFSYLLQRFGRGNEAQVLQTLARNYGLALTQSDNQGAAPTQGQPPAQAAPTAQEIDAQVQKALQAREAEAAQASMRKEVEAVRTNPKNLYFENVKDKVAALAVQAVNKGDKRSYGEIVQAAYDEAIWADPTVRPLLLQAEQKARDEAAKAAAAAKAEAAKKAAVSVTGSPQAPPARAPSTNRNLDAEIDAAINAAYEGARA